MHEMDSLKTQVADISSRVADIDGSISGLTQLVSSLITEANKRGHDSNTATDNGGQKRRRVVPAPFAPSVATASAEDNFQSERGQVAHQEAAHYSSGSDDAYDEPDSYSVSSDEHYRGTKRLDLPRGSELQEIEVLNSDFFRMNSGDLLDDDLSIEFDDFLGLAPQASLTVDAGAVAIKKEGLSTYVPPRPVSRSSSIAADVSAATSAPLPMAAVNDIPDILQYLSPEMQQRFVDRLAESVGSNFAKLLATSIGPLAPPVNIPVAPAMSMNNYSPHFLQQIQNQQDQTTFWPSQQQQQQQEAVTSSGSSYNAHNNQISPAMVLPLASAALCSLIAVHCSGSNANSATCIAVKAATAASGVTHLNGVSLSSFGH